MLNLTNDCNLNDFPGSIQTAAKTPFRHLQYRTIRHSFHSLRGSVDSGLVGELLFELELCGGQTRPRETDVPTILLTSFDNIASGVGPGGTDIGSYSHELEVLAENPAAGSASAVRVHAHPCTLPQPELPSSGAAGPSPLYPTLDEDDDYDCLTLSVRISPRTVETWNSRAPTTVSKREIGTLYDIFSTQTCCELPRESKYCPGDGRDFQDYWFSVNSIILLDETKSADRQTSLVRSVKITAYPDPRLCRNNVKDRDELYTDCGGAHCPSCCVNGRQDENEEGIDCGGPCRFACAPTAATAAGDGTGPDGQMTDGVGGNTGDSLWWLPVLLGLLLLCAIFIALVVFLIMRRSSRRMEHERTVTLSQQRTRSRAPTGGSGGGGGHRRRSSSAVAMTGERRSKRAMSGRGGASMSIPGPPVADHGDDDTAMVMSTVQTIDTAGHGQTAESEFIRPYETPAVDLVKATEDDLDSE